jgi:uncharacterized membrane protein
MALTWWVDDVASVLFVITALVLGTMAMGRLSEARHQHVHEVLIVCVIAVLTFHLPRLMRSDDPCYPYDGPRMVAAIAAALLALLAYLILRDVCMVVWGASC